MTESINSYHSLETEFSKLNLERKINYEVEEIDLTETNDFDPDITLDGSENLFPPPYNHSMTRNPHSDNPNMNMMLYEKMLNLECLVSNIHETVVDSPLLNSDVSQQLKEINDTMNRFQKEASVRLRQKLSVKPDCQTIFNDDGSQPQKTPTIETEEDCFPVEDSQRYDRVCSMVESLISDANTVLSNRGAPSKELFQKQLENDLDELGPLMKSSADEVHKTEEMIHQHSEPVVPCAETQPIKTSDNNDDSLVFEFSLNFNRSGKSNTRSMKKKLTLPLFRQNSLNSSNKSIANGTSKQSSETALIDPTLVSFSNYGTVGLLVLLGYWTFLFTLGTVLLDSSLCDMAGLHVMELVDAISGSQVKRVGQRRLGSKKSFPRIEYQIPTAPPKHRRSSF